MDGDEAEIHRPPPVEAEAHSSKII